MPRLRWIDLNVKVSVAAVLVAALVCFNGLALAREPDALLKPERTLEGHTDAVMDVAFFPDSARIASGAHDKTVCTWDVASGKLLHVYHGAQTPVYSVSVSKDGKRVAAGTYDHTALVWDVASGRIVAMLKGKSRAMHVAFLPDGHLLSGCGDGVLRVWDVDSEKQLWQSEAEECVTALAVTPDGRRAAYGACDGIVRVWDLVKHQRVGKFGQFKEYEVDTLGLTDDGSLVYRGVYNDGIRCFNVDTGKEQTLSKRLTTGDKLTCDGQWAINRRDVLGVSKAQTVCAVELDFLQTRSIAVSADHQHVAVAGGGWGYDDNKSWEPRQDNFVHLYRLPGGASPPGTAPPGATQHRGDLVSWATIPVRRRTPSGDMLPVSDIEVVNPAAMRRLWNCFALHVTRGGKPDQPLDVIYSPASVMLQSEPGVLDEVLNDPKASYSDVVWDGKQLWVATRSGSIFAMETDGRIVRTINAGNGLPPATRELRLWRLGEGKILAAGADESAGWCATIEVGGDGAAPKLNVFFHEADIRDAWRAEQPVPSNWPLFWPISITEPPITAGPRVVWVVCSRTQRLVAPILKINTQTLQCTSYNLNDPAFVFKPDVPIWMGFNPQTITWLDAQTLLVSAGGKLMRAKVGAQRLERSEAKCLATITEGRQDFLAPVPIGEALFYPGNNWYRLDLKTFDVRHIGPGVCINEKPRNGGMETFVSAHFGLVSFSPADDCFFRLSVDPAHALANHPLIAKPHPWDQPSVWIPNHVGTDGQFMGGGGELSFHNGKLNEPEPFTRGVHVSAMNRMIEKGISLMAADEVRFRMFDVDERDRCGLTDKDLQRFIKFLEDTQSKAALNLDVPKLEAMFKTFAPSVGTARQQAAAQPLIGEARKLGERWAHDEDQYLAQLRGFFSDRQWKLMFYEDPDAPGEPDTWVVP